MVGAKRAFMPDTNPCDESEIPPTIAMHKECENQDSEKDESKFGKYKLQAPDEQDDARKDRQNFRCGEKHHEWQFSGKSYPRMCRPVHASVMKPSSSRCSAMPGRRTILQYWP